MKNWVKKKIVDISTVFEDGDWIESKDQSAEGIRLIQTGNTNAITGQTSAQESCGHTAIECFSAHRTAK